MAISSRFPVPLAFMKNNSFVSSQSSGNTSCSMLSYRSELQTVNAFSRDTFFRVLHTQTAQLQHQSTRPALRKSTDTPHHCQSGTSSVHLRFLWQHDSGNTSLPSNKQHRTTNQLHLFPNTVCFKSILPLKRLLEQYKKCQATKNSAEVLKYD